MIEKYERLVEHTHKHTSDENNAEISRDDILGAPVVKIVVKLSIARSKLEWLQKAHVFHNIEAVENIKVFILCVNQHLLHALLQSVSSAHIIV